MTIVTKVFCGIAALFFAAAPAMADDCSDFRGQVLAVHDEQVRASAEEDRVQNMTPLPATDPQLCKAEQTLNRDSQAILTGETETANAHAVCFSNPDSYANIANALDTLRDGSAKMETLFKCAP